jgi:23S rRNA pseudouridine1911/1915/1917 synthase
MDNKLVCEITKEQDGRKLINFLKSGTLKFSTRLCRKLVRGGYVLINGERAKYQDVIKEGDKIEITLNRGETQDIEPQDIPIDVAYEDLDLLVVNKPPFMVVHPTKSHQENTLANGIINYFRETNQNCIVRLVNRLDRDTSGLVIVAKSQYAHQAMARKLDDNQIEKYYIAVVEGRMEGKGTIDMPIDRPSQESMKRVVMEGGQRAVTHYDVIEATEEMSVLKIRLETGKTHQIRVHMSTIGHPIVGDTLYGSASELITRQALHAYMLKFESLRDRKMLEITTKVPDDMQKLLNIVEHKE